MSETPKRIRLLLVDDSELVRTGLRTLLSAAKDLQIVGEAGNAREGVRLCLATKADVLLLDIRLPDGNGVEVCREVSRSVPALRIIMLTSTAEEHTVDQAIEAGAHGYLLKEINGASLQQAIRDVAEGKSILDPAVTARLLNKIRTAPPVPRLALTALAPQEEKVLALIAQGKTNKEVAGHLGLAEKTVKNYLSTIFDKLQVTRRSQAAVIYSQRDQSRLK